eukprot:1826926-Prymnesium_polylepis.1
MSRTRLTPKVLTTSEAWPPGLVEAFDNLGLGRSRLECFCPIKLLSARAPVRSGNPDWLPNSAGRVAGSPRTWRVRP